MKNLIVAVFSLISFLSVLQASNIRDDRSGTTMSCQGVYNRVVVGHNTTTQAVQNCWQSCSRCGFLRLSTCCSTQCSTAHITVVTAVMGDVANRGGVSHGTEAMNIGTAPNIHRCARGHYTGTWVNHGRNICSGLNFNNFGPGTSGWILDNGQGCWRWNCARDFAHHGEGRCVNRQQCNSENRDWVIGDDGVECLRFDWCPGWSTGFNTNIHIPIDNGPCQEFRCRDQVPVSSHTSQNVWMRQLVIPAIIQHGFRWPHGFAAADARTNCQPVDQQLYTRNTTFVNNGLVGNGAVPAGVVARCSNREHTIMNNNGTWSCQSMILAARARFDACWGCRTREDLITCLNSTEEPSPTNDLSGCFIRVN